MRSVKRILFVCLGNICRSPAAEGIMLHMVRARGLDDEFEIDSAGVGSWHVGQLPDRRMISSGQKHGYQFGSRARQVSPRDFDHFDVVVVMDDYVMDNLQPMLPHGRGKARLVMMADYLRHHPGINEIADPYYGSARDFDKTIELLEDACEGLLDEMVGPTAS